MFFVLTCLVTVEQIPVENLQTLQDLVSHRHALFDEHTGDTLLQINHTQVVLARNVRDVDGDHDISPLVLEANKGHDESGEIASGGVVGVDGREKGDRRGAGTGNEERC